MVGLAELLEANGFLVIDGAMGTELFAAGLTAGDPPELWNLDHPDRIRAIHQAYVDAGSDIILTNSFGGNRHRLKLHSLEGRVPELNAAAASIGREVADAADRPVLVAGSMGPTGALIEPLGALPVAEAAEEAPLEVRARPLERAYSISASVPSEAVRAVDAVVHLAGEPVFGGLPTRARKQRIRASRVDATRGLVDEKPTLLTDGGVENFNNAVDELVDSGLLRRLLGLAGEDPGGVSVTPKTAGSGFEDATYAILFPEGFEISRTYKGRPYAARVVRGRWRLDADGRAYDSLNQLSQAVIDGNENAWMFWFYQAPDGARRRIAELRDPALVQRRPRRKSRRPSPAPAPAQVSATPPSTPVHAFAPPPVTTKTPSPATPRSRPPLADPAPPLGVPVGPPWELAAVGASSRPRPLAGGMAWEPAPKAKRG